jgi:predicted metal-dependent hydrolase
MEYIVYHEMLHLKHPVKMRGSRRCVHGKEFREDENAFPRVDEARRFLKTL